MAFKEYADYDGLGLAALVADEATLYRLAGQLEKELPWGDRKPAVWN